MNHAPVSSRLARVPVAELIAIAITLCAAPSVTAQTAWKPDRTVEVVVFAAPGGGNDKSARMMHKIWQETKLLDAVITNKVGGGGSLAYTYVSQKAGDAHHIAIAQAGLVTNHITGRSPLHYSDLTPLSFVGSVSSTCHFPSRVRARRAKMSRMSCVRSTTLRSSRSSS